MHTAADLILINTCLMGRRESSSGANAACCVVCLNSGEPSIKIAVLVLGCLSLFVPPSARAQAGFFNSWQDRVRATTANQPSWTTPLVTTFAGVTQRFRFEMARQENPTGTFTYNYGNSKGVNLIPFARTEVDFRWPPYIQHNSPRDKDGAGDFSIAPKYRLFAANEKHGNYSSAVQLIVTFPTGSYKNGSPVVTLTPTLVAGKGFGPVAVQSSIGALLPTSSTATLGRSITSNTVVQCNAPWHLVPELELNSTFFRGGPRDGKNQTFLTPALMISRIKLRSEPKDRMGLTFGAGVQIATSSYHAYNHALILTSRFTF